MKSTYIAEMRIRHNGEPYKAGDKIELDDDELNALPKGAVKVMPDIIDTTTESGTDENKVSAPTLTPEEQEAHDKLVAAVDALDAGAFKKDGGIRKDTLEQLVADLGFDITADDVATIVASKGA